MQEPGYFVRLLYLGFNVVLPIIRLIKGANGISLGPTS